MIDLKNDFKAAASFAIKFDGSPTVMTEGFGGKELGIDLGQKPLPGSDYNGPSGMGG